jgi:transcriptional regulator with XRE-family HTH domain
MEFLVDQLASRLRDRRAARGWTLERLAEASGVSRAMISKIERGEVSPTATILARLAAGFGITLARLFSEDGVAPQPLSRRAEQPLWRDPASGYERRNLSPAGAALELVEVRFPAQARVVFDNAAASPGIEQQVYLLDGTMTLTVGGEETRLEAGDCLRMALTAPIVFHNPGPAPARYLVALARATP